MPIQVHLILTIPLIVSLYVTWRLIHHKEKLAAGMTGLVAFGFVLLHPTLQTVADGIVAVPYANNKEKLAIQHEIIGKKYMEISEVFGEPNRRRTSTPTVSNIATRKITRKLDTKQRLDYYASPLIYLTTYFRITLDENGIVTGYSVNPAFD